jgi:hypothetical protein
MLSDFTAVANAIAETTKKSVKERLLADDYFHRTTIEKYGSVLKVEGQMKREEGPKTED